MTLSTFKSAPTIPVLSRKQAIIELHEMLTYMRPAGTKAEQAFVARYIDMIPGVWGDGYGNRHLIIGNTDVLWSSHTDTVHSYGGRQTVLKGDGLFVLQEKQTVSPSCLGGDCTTGVWIMRQMIARGIPGHYVFHRDEECGGLGSSWVAKNDPGLLDGVKMAIAFDRKGYSSVITHQGRRTASDDFAKSVAAQLGGEFKPDDTGLFTDTAKYADIIPECSNLSVGYHNAHSPQEWQDWEFAWELLERICQVDTTKFEVARDPKVVEYNGWAGRHHWTDHYDFGDDDWDRKSWLGRPTNSNYVAAPSVTSTTTAIVAARQSMYNSVMDEKVTRGSTNYQRLYNLIMDFPDELADVLDNEGMDAETLADMIQQAMFK